MGAVHLARRADDELERQVAIKLLRGGFEGKEAERRFRLERQILAGLDHPHIAKLLDGGSTADQLPYLVLELIEGVPIDEYCERRDLGLEDRLRLNRFCSAPTRSSPAARLPRLSREQPAPARRGVRGPGTAR